MLLLAACNGECVYTKEGHTGAQEEDTVCESNTRCRRPWYTNQNELN